MFSLLNDNEMFLDVEGYEGLYSVSNFGRVYSHQRGGRFLKPAPDINFYLIVVLYKDKTPKTNRVHALVGNAFIGKRENEITFDHIDRNRQNNRVDNIRLATKSEQQINKNIQHNNKTGEKNISERSDGYYQVKIQRNGKIVFRKCLRMDKFSLSDAVKVRDEYLATLE